MKTKCSIGQNRFRCIALRIGLAAFALGVSQAAAQSTTADSPPSSTEAKEEKEVILLSPFQVSAQANRGYVATQSLVATGFGQDIYRTPINITVLTSEFIKDLNLPRLESVAGYLSGVSFKGNDTINRGDGGNFVVRGFPVAYYTRNGIRRYVTSSGLENVDRVEAIKGPVSVFFGNQAPGGVINYVTKRPSFNQESEVTVRAGSYDGKYASVSSQGPLSDKFAYRLFASKTDNGGWRDFVFQKRDYLYGGLLFQPTPKLQIYLEYEHTKSSENQGAYLPEGNPQYFADWKNPTAAQRAYAIANQLDSNPFGSTQQTANVKANAGNVVGVLRDRWRTNYYQYTQDVQAATGVAAGASVAVYDLYPQGAKLNVGGPDGITNNLVDSLEAELNYKINDIFSVRGLAMSDDVTRSGFTSWSQQPNGDGSIFSSQTGNFDLNRSTQLAVELLSQFEIKGSKQKILVGLDAYRDAFYGQGSWRGGPDAFTVPFNQVPSNSAYTGPAGSVQPTTLGTYLNPGWDPRTGYFDGKKYFANGVLPSFSVADFNQHDINNRDSYYGSWSGQFLSDRLTTLAGLRHEETGSRTVYRDGRPEYVSNPTKATIPTFGATYEFKPGFSAFSSYSESFERNYSGRVTGIGATLEEQRAPNEANIGKGFDVGFKASTADHVLSGAVTYYQAKRSEGYVYDEAASRADPRNANGANNVQINRWGGTVLTRGFEFDVVVNPTRNYTFTLSYSYIPDAYISAVANPSDAGSAARIGKRVKTPKNQYSTWHRYTFTNGALKGFSFGAGFHGETDKPKSGSPEDQGSLIKGATIVDAMIRYETTGYKKHPLSLTLNVSNLLDKAYILDWNGSQGFLPGDQRILNLTLNTKF